MSISNKNIIGSNSGILFDRTCYIGIVRDNIDPQKMNRIKVWIPELKGHPDQPETWHTISYASMSSSYSDINKNNKTTNTYEDSQQSWGWWATTPEINSEVLILFVNGEPNRGFYFASPFTQNMNHSIPAFAGNIPVNKKESCNGLPPVTEYNRRDENTSINPQRPIFDPLYNGLCSQGLLSDTERGTGSSSARRESPSKVSGYKSPRGNHLVFDDDPENEFIRLRTRTGNQILLHATTGYVYICSKLGNSWIEISDDGIDVYSKFSISFHAERDINLHANNDINIHAERKIHTFSGNNTEHFIGANHLTKTIGLNAIEAKNITEKFTLKEQQGLIKDNGVPIADIIYDKTQTHYYLQKFENCCGTQTTKSSITTRLPTHEPWVLHPNKNKTVKNVTDNASTYKVAPKANTITNRESTIKNTSGENTSNVPQKKEIKTGTGEKVQVNKNNISGDKVKLAGKNIPIESKNAIEEAVNRTDTNYGYMMAMAEAESNFDPDAKAKTSSASGLYQFTDNTWKGMVDKYGNETGISLEDKNDPRANAVMAGLYTKENEKYLQKNLGREPTNTDLYMGHFLGANGAKKILTADPNGNAATSNPTAANANKSIFYNKDGSARTNAQVIQIMSNKIEPKAQVYNQSILTS